MLLHERLAQQERTTTIGDLFEVTKKPRGLDLSQHAQIPFVPMDAIPQGGAFAPRYDMKPSSESGAGTYFERCDVLVGKITPSFENGKQALVCDLPSAFGFATTEVIPLRPRCADRDRRLLFYYLLHPDIRSFVAGRMEGATGRKRVPEDVLLELPFPAFDSDEEQAISDCLSGVRSSIDTETGLMKQLESLKRSAMRELFTRGLRGEASKDSEVGPLPESWDARKVERLAKVKGGKRMPKGVSLTTENTGRPYIRVTDFDGHSVRKNGILFVPRGYENVIARYRISSADVYISIAGSIGIVGQVPPDLDDANLTENAAKLVVEREDVSARYLMHALTGACCQEQIVLATAKNAQPKLALTRIEQLLVPMPQTLEEQKEIVTVLDAIDAKIDLHKRKKAILEELFRALLNKLMTGEIRVADLDLTALEANQKVAA